MKYDTVLIADVDQHIKETGCNQPSVDLPQLATALSVLLRPLGRYNRSVALIPANHPEAHGAFQRAGFLVWPIDGNRSRRVKQFIKEELQSLNRSPPLHLVVMTADPHFGQLCSCAARAKAKVSIWSPGDVAPPCLQRPVYDCRSLSELLPGASLPLTSVSAYLDYENLCAGLRRLGYRPTPHALVEAVRRATADLGNMVEIVAYADWSVFANCNRMDVQRQLVMLGVTTVYVINRHGKNSADMALANDVRTQLEYHPGSTDGIDAIVIGSCDRDFRTILETARSRGKRTLVLGLSTGVSQDLMQQAEVRYLDAYLEVKSRTH
jgi:hypothetical protein